MRRACLLVLLLLILPACQRPPMVLPLMFEAGRVDAFFDTKPSQQTNRQRLFYVTDRRFDPDCGALGRFTRHRSDGIKLGHLDVAFGPPDAWPRIVAATRAQSTGRRYNPTINALVRYGDMPWHPAGSPTPQPLTDADDDNAPAMLPERLFIEQLDRAVRDSSGKEITIFVHGYRKGFDNAAYTAAELGLYTAGLGPVVLYSWPSYNSLYEYSHDRDAVRYTTAHARRFVEFLADEIAGQRLNATRINLVAHSTGCEVVGSVLRELALMTHGQPPEARRARWKLGTVLLVAPDISTDVARERVLKEDLGGLYEQIVVYTSARDTALAWASWFLYRAPRLGSLREKDLTAADRFWLSKAPNVALVNVDSQPNLDPIDHSHHRYSAATLSDMLLALRSDLPPDQRGLVREEGQLIWRFADDYAKRVTDIAATVYRPASGPISNE